MERQRTDRGLAVISCIRSLPLRRLQPRENERKVQQLISAFFKKGSLSGEERINRLVNICDEFRRTPYIPLFLQGEDWPYCCGDFTEYIGAPDSYPEAARVAREVSYWSEGPDDFVEFFGEEALEPEDLDEICVFRCLECRSQVFTWQAT